MFLKTDQICTFSNLSTYLDELGPSIFIVTIPLFLDFLVWFITINQLLLMMTSIQIKAESSLQIALKAGGFSHRILFLYSGVVGTLSSAPFLRSTEQKERGFISIDWPMGHLTNNSLKKTKSNLEGIWYLSLCIIEFSSLLVFGAYFPQNQGSN